MLNLPVDMSNAVENVSAAYDALRNVTCKGNANFFISSINISFIDDVRTEIESLSTDALDDLVDKVRAKHLGSRYMGLRESPMHAVHSSTVYSKRGETQR